MLGYITSNSLRNRRLRLSDSLVYSQCTILPLFDDEGVVRQTMVVQPVEQEVYFFNPSQVKLLFPWWIWWGEIAVQSSFPTLQTADDIDVEQLFLLWHFDPWGVVASLEPKHRWSRGLTSANCLNRFVLKQGTVSSVWYTGDLLRLGLVEKKYLGSTELKRYDRTMLPTREDEAEGIAAQIRFEWRLTPFWLSE